jgi:hypothetical protein
MGGCVIARNALLGARVGKTTDVSLGRPKRGVDEHDGDEMLRHTTFTTTSAVGEHATAVVRMPAGQTGEGDASTLTCRMDGYQAPDRDAAPGVSVNVVCRGDASVAPHGPRCRQPRG